MIKFRNVTKTYGEVVALKNISFEIDKGEFVFITGPSGSGKTTILKLILGEIVPDAGEVWFNNINIAKVPAKDLFKLRQKIGCVFQDYKVIAQKTVEENVEIGLAVVGITEDKWTERVEKALKLVSLYARRSFFPAQLSGGELQRVSLARALVINPDLILADEPTGNLDWDTADEIMGLLTKVNKEGKTVVIAMHNKEIIAKMKKKVIKLTGGKMASEKII